MKKNQEKTDLFVLTLHKFRELQKESKPFNGEIKSTQTSAIFAMIHGINLAGAPTIISKNGFYWRLTKTWIQNSDKDYYTYLPVLEHIYPLTDQHYYHYYKNRIKTTWDLIL